MKQIINGENYNTDTATHICALKCAYYPGEYDYHETALYLSQNGRYFLSGEGGPNSMWATIHGTGGRSSGYGINLIDKLNAWIYADLSELSADKMIAAGFEGLFKPTNLDKTNKNSEQARRDEDGE